MRKNHVRRVITFVIAVALVLTSLPISSFASIANWETVNQVFSGSTFGTNGYYNVISKKDYTLIPGAAVESEIVINNSTGNRRNVMHIIEVDPSNPDVSILPGYYGIDTDWATNVANQKAAGVTDVAAYYEDTLGYNVVGAMNTALAYDCNAPYSYLVYNGEVLVDYNNNINNFHSGSCQTMLCVYKDAETGECSVELRTRSQGLRGDEWQAIGANFAMVVNNGALVTKTEERTSEKAARSMVGVKEDGTLVLVMNDGRGANNSVGFNNYEEGEAMLALGCKWAFNCDGGGSSSFVSKRVGEDSITMRSVPCDGAERPTLNSVLIVSNVAPTGVLNTVNVESEYDYFAPGSSYNFTASAIDTHGYAMDMPADATWSLSDSSFGTLTNGTFVSNGTLGEVDIQIVSNGEIVGSRTINVANPATLSFAADSTTLPYGKSTTLSFVSLIGEAPVYLDGSCFEFTLSNNAGTLNGLTFTAGNDESITSSVVTAKYLPQNKVLTFTINFGKGSEILYDFEDGIEGWMGYDEVIDFLYNKGYIAEKSYRALNDYYNGTGTDNFSECVVTETFLSTAENGYVHNGSKALGIEFDFTQVTFNDWCYGVLFNTTGGVLRDVANNQKAIRLGMWLRMPENFVQDAGKWANQLTIWKGTDAAHLAGAQIHFQYNGKNLNTLTEADIPENRWIYVTAALPTDNYVRLADADSNLYRSPSFLRTYIKPNVSTKFVWYIDDITLDYSSAVEDCVAPVINNPQYATSDTNISFTNGATIESTSAGFTAYVSDDNSGIDVSTAQIYVDGNAVSTSISGNMLYSSAIALGTGRHLVTFEIADNNGNYTTLTREIVSAVTAEIDKFMWYRTRIEIEGRNDSGEIPMPGSVYYIDITSSYAEPLGTAEVTLELNTANEWILDQIQPAEGYEVSCKVDNEHTNKITLTITSNKYNSSKKVICSVPVRVYNPVLTASSEATPQAVSGRTFTAALNVKCYAKIYSYGNYDTFAIDAFAGNRVVTRHEHTATAIADQQATCTEIGYTGRTYCNECKSVVDWGTTVPATGHNYTLADGKFTCACGDVLALGTGLVTVNEKIYYSIGGNLVNGWQEIDGKWYYFNTTTYEARIGSMPFASVTYVFGEDGALTSGVWRNDGTGYKYYYGPDYYRCKAANPYANAIWETIDGKTYAFDRNGYRHSGISMLMESNSEPSMYEFDDEGVLIGPYETDYTGIFPCNNGKLTYLVNGVPTAQGLVRVDNDYYYFNSSRLAVTGTYNCTNHMTALVPAGTYEFDSTGKMINPPQDPTPEPTAEPTPTPEPTEPPVEKVMKYLSVNKKSDKIRYYLGEEFDCTGLVLNVFYTDGTREAVSYADLEGVEITNPDINLTGTQSVYVSYNGFQTKFSVVYGGRADVRGIKLAAKPTKVYYKQGERFDPTGIVVNAVAQDLSVVFPIPVEELTFTSFRNDEPALVTVRVFYMDYYDTSFSVRVTAEKLVSGITATKPTKVSYKVGEAFDPTGMTVTAKYSDATTSVVDNSKVTVTGFDSTSVGVKTITLTYEGKSTTFSIRVS